MFDWILCDNTSMLSFRFTATRDEKYRLNDSKTILNRNESGKLFNKEVARRPEHCSCESDPPPYCFPCS